MILLGSIFILKLFCFAIATESLKIETQEFADSKGLNFLTRNSL